MGDPVGSSVCKKFMYVNDHNETRIKEQCYVVKQCRKSDHIKLHSTTSGNKKFVSPRQCFPKSQLFSRGYDYYSNVTILRRKYDQPENDIRRTSWKNFGNGKVDLKYMMTKQVAERFDRLGFVTSAGYHVCAEADCCMVSYKIYDPMTGITYSGSAVCPACGDPKDDKAYSWQYARAADSIENDRAMLLGKFFEQTAKAIVEGLAAYFK